MKFLVIGCGSIGGKHIRHLKTALGQDVIAYDTENERLRSIEKKYGVKTYENMDRAFAQEPAAVLICTPTSTHIPIGIIAAAKGCHLFIEKPLSHSLEGIERLINIVREKKLVTLVGCNMRFFASLKQVKNLLEADSIGRVLSVRASCGYYLPYWHTGEDYRKGYTANKSLGGGIILDDIHEIDYLRWLLGEVKEVFCIADKVSRLEMDTEDLAAIILRFTSGAVAEVHLDCIQQDYRRSCEFYGETGIIIWDYIAENVKLFTEKEKKWRVFAEGLKTGRDEMFIAEMRHFIDCIEGKDTSVNDVTAAKRVLEIALAAKESARIGNVVKL